jgi:hypothetical protein
LSLASSALNIRSPIVINTVDRFSLAVLIIYLRKVMMRDNVVKIKKVDKAKAFVRDYLADGALKSTKEVKAAAAPPVTPRLRHPFLQKFTGPNRPRKRAPFARYILAIHSHSAVEQQGLSVDRYG